MRRTGLAVALALLFGMGALQGCNGSGGPNSLHKVGGGEGGQGSVGTPTTGSSSEDQVQYAADSGFRPTDDGFAFANYGEAKNVENLTVADMVLMYGDHVCRQGTETDGCELTPPAKAVMDQYNQWISGGHCYGFSVMALALAKQQLKPTAYGAKRVPDITLDNNSALQHALARGWSAQFFESVTNASFRGKPNEILADLGTVLKKQQGETYTLSFWNRKGEEGHAVTPFGVVDRGQGTYGVRIYDNNFPAMIEEMRFDKNNNSWSYDGMTEPGKAVYHYDGDVNSKQPLELSPTTPALPTQPCPFCNGEKLANRPPVGTVFMSGRRTSDHSHLLLRDDHGRRTGLVDGKFLQEIPGVRVDAPVFDGPNVGAEPLYHVPLGTKLDVTVDGSGLSQPEPVVVGSVGPGISTIVENIVVNPGQQDQMTLTVGAAALTYTPGRSESPVLRFGSDEAQGPDYDFTVAAKDIKAQSPVSVALSNDKLDVKVAGQSATIDLTMARLDGHATAVFHHSAVGLGDGDAGSLLYRAWTAPGMPVTFDVSHRGVTKPQSLTDGGTGGG